MELTQSHLHYIEQQQTIYRMVILNQLLIGVLMIKTEPKLQQNSFQRKGFFKERVSSKYF